MSPRERVQAFLDSLHPKARYAAVSDPSAPLLREDLRAVLAANAGYESIIAEQRREAVAEYKRELAKELRTRAEEVFDHGAYHEVIDIADDLEGDKL